MKDREEFLGGVKQSKWSKWKENKKKKNKIK